MATFRQSHAVKRLLPVSLIAAVLLGGSHARIHNLAEETNMRSFDTNAIVTKKELRFLSDINTNEIMKHADEAPQAILTLADMLEPDGVKNERGEEVRQFVKDMFPNYVPPANKPIGAGAKAIPSP